MKIIEKIQESEQTFFSFEFFPPKTEQGKRNLYDRIERLVESYYPTFVDITWGAGGTTAEATLEIAAWIQKYSGVDVQMHLTCTNMSQTQIDNALEKCKEFGIMNILALRGDPPAGQVEWKQCETGFAYAIDLVKYIRQKHGNYFCISVAGYPEGHLEAESKQKDLEHLKQKVDAGADFIITQLFYDINEFINFYNECRKIGITCPIIPGIMPIQNYDGFLRMTNFCKTKIPQDITDQLNLIKNNDKLVKDFGVQICAKMCTELLEFGVRGLHFYTLNLEKSVSQILNILIDKNQNNVALKTGKKLLPWRQSALRGQLEVRPIFWSNRPKSYIDQTSVWEDLPNGRWGDFRSPAFDVKQYVSMNRPPANLSERLQEWGENPKNEEDIKQVFIKFLKGEVQRLPWTERSLYKETSQIIDFLIFLNQHGLLTINSQPQVNGVSSDDPVYGWGEHGFIYQKAYVEFFCNPQLLLSLKNHFLKYPSITFNAINKNGETIGNVKPNSVNAVSWGVFRDMEIIQPTIVSSESFQVWKDEAFNIWLSEWAVIYENESEPRTLLENISNTYFLVNVVENDYINGKIESVFQEFFN